LRANPNARELAIESCAVGVDIDPKNYRLLTEEFSPETQGPPLEHTNFKHLHLRTNIRRKNLIVDREVMKPFVNNTTVVGEKNFSAATSIVCPELVVSFRSKASEQLQIWGERGKWKAPRVTLDASAQVTK
jgi:hypothetical protein